MRVGTNRSYQRVWQSDDVPAPTVLTDADQHGGSGWIETGGADVTSAERDRLDQGLSPRTRVLELDAEQPAPTIQAHGINDVHQRQHRVDALTDPSVATTTLSPGKPAYRVPLMPEIAAIPWNGLKVASTFSGAGGSCLGYRMAGYRVVWASEFVPIACESYRANFPDTILDTRDIRTVTAGDVLEATGLERGQLDLLDGSPPCQPFSTAGKREKSWGKVREYGDHSQRADDLFFEYVRLVDGLQPRCFVAENVSGLVKGTAKGYFKQILAALKACGYVVTARLLDAQWLGVPQARQRIIFVGVRNDLGLQPAFPSPLPYRYSVRDALPWIGSLEGANGFNGHADSESDRPAWTIQAGRSLNATTRVVHDTSGEWGAGDITDRPSPCITIGVNSVNANHFQVETRRVEPEAMLNGLLGEEWDRLDPGQSSARHFSCKRTRLDGPSHAVTRRAGAVGAHGVTHPTERRKFTIAELRRICAFPDDFILCGSYAEQWARLGNAVPPVMMQHIATAIRDQILLPRLTDG